MRIGIVPPPDPRCPARRRPDLGQGVGGDRVQLARAYLDAVSGGRLTLDLGLGGRADDFVVDDTSPSVPATAFGRARAAWKAAGREGTRDLVAVAYFALGDEDLGVDELMLAPTVDEAWLADVAP
ncbi:hypothetical protein [Streptomyces sp. KR55]|uniref:hypothetical protein n=1 Tax=Streptomyces sp. KR55 TaxID=3457425 RepID=UPI003FD605C2